MAQSREVFIYRGISHPIPTALVAFLAFPSFVAAQNTTPAEVSSLALDNGQTLFQQNCAFCHGRDAAGGETGPDLLTSKLVASDVNGSNIGVVVRNGRPAKGMPGFNFSETQISELAVFIHSQRASAKKGRRRGVDVADLQSGNADAGRQYFSRNCSSCHSPRGDLAGLANRYQGLKLEERMLYPEGAVERGAVTLPSGEIVRGKVAYRDEFTIGLEDASGWYRSWPITEVKYTIDAPAEAHVELLSKYSDDDIHNLMAYLQTLR
jgi:cytochrome c oxidase cbb3-type subunit 3